MSVGNIVTGLLSGILGVFSASFMQKKLEERKFKIETLAKIIGNRDDIKSQDFVTAINVVPIIFNNKKVLSTYIAYHCEVKKGAKGEEDTQWEKFDSLIKEMCKDLKINTEDILEECILEPFSRSKKQ